MAEKKLIIDVGEELVEEFKAKESAKRGLSSETMAKADELLAGALSSSKKAKKK